MTLVFDTETTGKADFNAEAGEPQQPDMIQLGALLFDKDWRIQAELNVLVEPMGWEVSKEAEAIHGIGMEQLKQYGLPLCDVLAMFDGMASRSKVVVAHNVKFDSLILRTAGIRNFGHDGYAPWTYPEFCTMEAMTDLVKIPSPYKAGKFKWPTLQEAYKHCFGRELEGAHDAMADVRACADIYRWITTQKSNDSNRGTDSSPAPQGAAQ